LPDEKKGATISLSFETFIWGAKLCPSGYY